MKTKIRQIERELETADEYIHCAVKHDGNERDVYKALAADEIKHAEKLMKLEDEYKFEDEYKRKAWYHICEVFKDQIIELKTKHQMID